MGINLDTLKSVATSTIVKDVAATVAGAVAADVAVAYVQKARTRREIRKMDKAAANA